MWNRRYSIIRNILVLFVLLIIGGCQRASIPETTTPAIVASSTQQPYPQPATLVSGFETGLPYPQPTSQAVVSTLSATSSVENPPPLTTRTQTPTFLPQASQTQSITSPTYTPTPMVVSQYPGPADILTIDETQPYPGPQNTPTTMSYPGPATSTVRFTRTPSIAATATGSSGTQFLSITPTQGAVTAEITSTHGLASPTSIPTDMPPGLPLSPPPAGSSVTIWHSWGSIEIDTLQSITQSFKRVYPDVTFSLLYIPKDDLLKMYQTTAYFGQGPTLLLGPSKWGPGLFKETLVEDLNQLVPEDFLININPAALVSGRYHDALISLPLSQHGIVMFRNTALLSTPVFSFDELVTMSHEITHGGIVGSYLERGSYISASNILGLGGELMDAGENPAFNDSFGIEWLDLLAEFDNAGAVTFNTNYDLEMFKRGRVGIIIDGSWNISMLTQALISDNIAIDPWPTFGTGKMAGWVDTDSIYLNTNASSIDKYAALTFMGFLLDPNVQMRLAEVGHIPTVQTTQPRNMLIGQAMAAFSTGVPYPNQIDDDVLNVYWKELDMAIRNVFDDGVDSEDALAMANKNILEILRDLRTIP